MTPFSGPKSPIYFFQAAFRVLHKSQVCHLSRPFPKKPVKNPELRFARRNTKKEYSIYIFGNFE